MTAWGNGDGGTWFEVQISVPWVVAGTTGVQDVINIAVSEVGKRVNQSSARNSEIVVQDVACPSCGYAYEAALSTTDFALVVLTVIAEFPAESAEESSRVAKLELGVRMKDIPLTVLGARRATSERDAETETDANQESEPESRDTSKEASSNFEGAAVAAESEGAVATARRRRNAHPVGSRDLADTQTAPESPPSGRGVRHVD
ncbi:DUF555 domain-containing protein [Haloplanus halophilus]|uniref:DUF555 domain-containing protein n=1 Tax=Haloplanus halophilus TaxID=2949993 RepID=UPI00203A438A|nr:DUF555 domain-containing protein [Haloplanus sp. GDY1]